MLVFISVAFCFLFSGAVMLPGCLIFLLCSLFSRQLHALFNTRSWRLMEDAIAGKMPNDGQTAQQGEKAVKAWKINGNQISGSDLRQSTECLFIGQ
jgi:hypothetical protein